MMTIGLQTISVFFIDLIYFLCSFIPSAILNQRFQMLENFEKSIIFPAARWFIIGCMLLITLGFIYTLFPDSTSVSPQDVKSALANKTIENSNNLEMPQIVKEGLDKRNLAIVQGWLTLVPKERQKDFISGLEEVFQFANQENLPLSDAINTYKELKLTKYRETETSSLDKTFKTITSISCILIFVLLANLLGILAIERNTRSQKT